MKVCRNRLEVAITFADAVGHLLTPVTQEQIAFYQTRSLLLKI